MFLVVWWFFSFWVQSLVVWGKRGRAQMCSPLSVSCFNVMDELMDDLISGQCVNELQHEWQKICRMDLHSKKKKTDPPPAELSGNKPAADPGSADSYKLKQDLGWGLQSQRPDQLWGCGITTAGALIHQILYKLLHCEDVSHYNNKTEPVSIHMLTDTLWGGFNAACDNELLHDHKHTFNW